MARPRRILASSGGFVPTGLWGVLKPGAVMNRALALSGVEPTGDTVARHAIILDWSHTPLPE